MKKTILSAVSAVLLVSTSAMAEFETEKLSVGASYGFGNNGVLSFRGDYDISDMTDKPMKARIGYDRYSLDGIFSSLDYTWTYSVFYGGVYYDFSETLDIDDRIRPFAGLGFGFGSVSCSGSGCGAGISTPAVGGFYYIGGVQYELNEQFSAEASFTAWGGLSIGANYHFE